jgi:hypothetical protein
MKTIALNSLIVLLLVLPGISNSQTRDDIFRKETPITWLGVDFSEARYLGDPGTVDAGEMKNLFSRINQLILAEPDKYNLRKYFSKSYITPNLSTIDKINGSIDESKIISSDYNDFSRLNADKIQLMVNKYKFENINGIALVVIMEAMNKTSSQASMWVTFVNSSNNKVLLTSRITGKSGGFGFRNHWATSILNVFKAVQSKHYRAWQKGK